MQDSLLDIATSVLSMLRSLSPDLVDLVSGDVIDPAQYEQLLAVGFSSPTFEQEVSNFSVFLATFIIYGKRYYDFCLLFCQTHL